MGRIYLTTNLQTVSNEELSTAVQRIFDQLEDQVNGEPASVSLDNNNTKLPQGMAAGDPIFSLVGGVVRLGIFNGRNVQFQAIGDIAGSITVEQHGNLSGGSLHSIVTSSVNGFMIAADKVKLDSYKGHTASASPPSTTELPTDGDFCFHHDTGGAAYYVATNFSGTIKSALLT